MEGMETLGAFVENTPFGAFLRELFPGFGDMQAPVVADGVVATGAGTNGFQEVASAEDTQIASLEEFSHTLDIREPTPYEKANYRAGVEYIGNHVLKALGEAYDKLETLKDRVYELESSGALSHRSATSLIDDINEQQQKILKVKIEIDNDAASAEWSHNGDSEYMRSVAERAYTSGTGAQSGYRSVVEKVRGAVRSGSVVS